MRVPAACVVTVAWYGNAGLSGRIVQDGCGDKTAWSLHESVMLITD